METKKIEFEGSTGEKLSAKIDLPKSETKAYALFAHCFTCSKDLKAVGNITKLLLFASILQGLGKAKEILLILTSQVMLMIWLKHMNTWIKSFQLLPY